MSKCPYCDGTGKALGTRWNGDEYVEELVNCHVCDETGEVESNEEWFCGLPTEEKAEVFIGVCKDAFKAEEYRRSHWSDLQTIEYWKRWLKQPHTDKEEYKR